MEKESDLVLDIRKPYWSKKINLESEIGLLLATKNGSYLMIEKDRGVENKLATNFDTGVRWERFEKGKFYDTFKRIDFSFSGNTWSEVSEFHTCCLIKE